MGCNLILDQTCIELERRIESDVDCLNIKYLDLDRACGYSFCIDSTDFAFGRRQIFIQKQLKKITQLQALITTLNHSYQDHCLDQCYDCAQQIKRLKKSIDFSCLKDKNNFQQCNKLIDKIELEYHNLKHFENEIERGGWVFKEETSNIRISSRQQQTISVLMETIFEGVITDMDLMYQLIPFTKASYLQKIVARNIRIGYSELSIPFLSNRQACFQGVGYNRLKKNGSVFLFCRSLYDQQKLCQQMQYTPIKHQGLIQMSFNYLIIKYQPFSANTGKATMAINMDMKLNFIPMKLMNYIFCKFGEDLFKKTVQICKDFQNSLWGQNSKKNPELMMFFKTVVKKWFQQDNALIV